MELPHETTECTDRRRNHVRVRGGETSAEHRDELLLARVDLVLHRVLHALDQVPLDPSAVRHALTHRDEERVGRLARDAVRLLGREDRLGDERRDDVKRVGGDERDERREEGDAVALGAVCDLGRAVDNLVDHLALAAADDLLALLLAQAREDAVRLLLDGLVDAAQHAVLHRKVKEATCDGTVSVRDHGDEDVEQGV